MSHQQLTLGGLLEANARTHADSLAVVFPHRQHTFGAFAERARKLASALARVGLRRQDRVAVLAQNCMEFCEVYAACEWAGFITATVNFRLAAREIEFVLRDSGARVLIFEQAYTELIEALRPGLTTVEHYVCIGDAPDWAQEFEQFAADGDPQGTTFRARESDVAYLIYTSGTTGRPKGCMLGQRAEVERARITSSDIRAGANDRILLTMPLFHIGAKAMLTAVHWVGGCAIFHREFRPRAILEAIQADRITICHMAPTMVQTLIDDPAIDTFDLSSLRKLVYSAAAMPYIVLRRGLEILGPVFQQIYGLTEGLGTTLAPEFHRADGDERDRRRLQSIGVPSPGVELRIVDEEGQECPPGGAGEILLRAGTLMLGYWNDSAASIAALRGGWLHTGDIGKRDTDGFIYLVDRKKDMIVSGGENIYSREVEEVLCQHPEVAEVAVIAVPDARWGEAVRAVVARKAGATVTADELIAWVRMRIASYKKPKSVVFVAALPKTPNGKIDKANIRQLHGAP